MSTTKSKKTRRYVSKKRARMIALREQQIIQEVNRGDDQLEVSHTVTVMLAVLIPLSPLSLSVSQNFGLIRLEN